MISLSYLKSAIIGVKIYLVKIKTNKKSFSINNHNAYSFSLFLYLITVLNLYVTCF